VDGKVERIVETRLFAKVLLEVSVVENRALVTRSIR
jgi:hypothetical protein